MDKNMILGIDNKPTTLIKFDVFNMDKSSLTGVISPDFKDNEEYKSFSEQVESTKNG